MDAIFTGKYCVKSSKPFLFEASAWSTNMLPSKIVSRSRFGAIWKQHGFSQERCVAAVFHDTSLSCSSDDARFRSKSAGRCEELYVRRNLSPAPHLRLRHPSLARQEVFNGGHPMFVAQRRDLRLPLRKHIHTSSALLGSPEEKSKLEQTIQHLRQELEEESEKAKKIEKVKLVKKEEGAIEVAALGRVRKMGIAAKDMFNHYVYGFQLLLVDIKISALLTWRYLKGEQLSRRERKQWVRTAADIFRMVPFSVFIIVPSLELALPFVLKLFPGFLPSTFQEKDKQEAALTKQLKLKIAMAKFLQDAMEELAVERKSKSEEESKAMQFARFMIKVRNEGGYVSNSELLKYVKLFEDEFTLDNMSLSQLRALCKIVGVAPIGTPKILNFLLRMKLRDIRADDQSIAAEGGVDKLTVAELQAANRARGMRALGLSEERLKAQLSQWLELSLNEKVPPSLLLWSRTMYLSEDMSFTDRLKNVFSQIPDSVAAEAKIKLEELEGKKIDNKARLDLIRQLEAALKKERLAESAAKEQEEKKLELERAKEKEAAAKKEEPKVEAIEPATDELVDKAPILVDKAPVLEPEAVVPRPSSPKKELDSKDIRDLETVLHSAAGDDLHEEKEDLKELKEQVNEHLEDVKEVQLIAKERGQELKDTKAARRLSKKVEKLISSADSLLGTLHGKRMELGEEIKLEQGSSSEKKLQIVGINELVLSLRKIQKIPDEVKEQQIIEALTALDDDSDGAIDLELALKVIDTIGKENVKIAPEQMALIRGLLSKEHEMEAKLKTEFKLGSEEPKVQIPNLKEIAAIAEEVQKKKPPS